MIFRSPIGGCLYSIETMSTFFPVGNFWKSFFCSFICALVFQLYKNLINMEFWPYILKDSLTNIDTTLNKDIIAFAFLGIICGLIGPIHINLIKFLIL
jgi:chloride channel 3/4/5